MNWPSWVLSGLAVLIAAASLFWNRRQSETQASVALAAGLSHLQERCSLLEMKMGIFWRMIEENLSGLLKKPTHLEMDALLDKLAKHTLTLDEARLLRTWLRQVYLDDAKTYEQQRLTAILVLGAVEALIHEFERHA